MKPPHYTKLPARFWDKVAEPDENDCWLWTASALRGYGRVFIQGKNQRANRLSTIDAHGPIPDGMLALHHCDNPPCVYHGHLYIGSPQDNMDDMKRRGRSRRAMGEDHPHSIFTTEQVKEFRKLYATGNYTYQRISDMYGVSASGVGDIVTRRRWGHVK